MSRGRAEGGPPASPSDLVAPVTDFEMATRLSYFFWGISPDHPLPARAQAGQLHTPDQIKTQVLKMAQDPRAKATVSTFHREWLSLSSVAGAGKDATMFPKWTSKIAADMYTEAQTFTDEIFWKDGHSDTLFGASYTYVNQELAAFYGLTPPTGAGFSQVPQDATRRAGVLRSEER